MPASDQSDDLLPPPSRPTQPQPAPCTTGTLALTKLEDHPNSKSRTPDLNRGLAQATNRAGIPPYFPRHLLSSCLFPPSSMAEVDYEYGDAADYGYGDSAPDSTDYGYGDSAPDNTDYGYGETEVDMGYGQAEPSTDYGYQQTDYGYEAAADYGYGATDYGYGDEPKEQEPAPAPPKKDRPKRRCSVTKYSLDTTSQETQTQIDRIAQIRAGNFSADSMPPPETAPPHSGGGGSKGEWHAEPSPSSPVPARQTTTTASRGYGSPRHTAESPRAGGNYSNHSGEHSQELGMKGKLSRLRKRLSIFN
jgi:hypothetical protein